MGMRNKVVAQVGRRLLDWIPSLKHGIAC